MRHSVVESGSRTGGLIDCPKGWELKDFRGGVGAYDKSYECEKASIVAGGPHPSGESLIIVFLYPRSELPMRNGTRFKILGLGVAYENDLPDKLPKVMKAVDQLLVHFDFESPARSYSNRFLDLLRDVGVPEESLRVIEAQ